MSKIEKVGSIIIIVTTIQFMFMAINLSEKHKETERKLDKVIELLKQEL